MYRRLYRQEGGGLGGGLSDLNAQAFMRQYVDKHVQDYNRGNQGEVAARVMPRPVPQAGIGQRIKKGLSSLVPDAVKTLTVIPETFRKSIIGDDNIRRTPEMDRNLEDIIKNQNTGLEGKINYSDYGLPDFVAEAKKLNLPQRNIDAFQNSPATLGIPATRKEFMDIINAGPNAIANALTLGRLGYSTDPITGKVSFTSGEFDFPAEGTGMESVGDWINQGGFEGFYNRMKSKITGEEINSDTQKPINIQPENVYNPNTVAALQYGDIEAQAEANRLNQEQEITNNPYIGASTNSPMWFGGYPLQSGDTLTTEQIRMNRQGGSKDYRIPPNLTTQYNEDGTGTIISKPTDEINNTPGYNTDNWFKALEYYNPNYREQRANAFQPVATPISMQNEQPINTGGFGVDFTNSNRDLINATDFNLLQNYYQGQQ
mgnify:FL=1